jgi:hypothetical protein
MGVGMAARQRDGVRQSAAVMCNQQQLVLPHVFVVPPSSSVALTWWPCIQRYDPHCSNTLNHTVFSLHPTLTGYNGHTFWDCETWMFPPLLALQPSTALQLLQCVPRALVPFASRDAKRIS